MKSNLHAALRQLYVAILIAFSVMVWSQRAPAVPVTISGTIRYTAPEGNEADDLNNALDLFPARGARVELWDDNLLLLNLPPDILIGTTYTDDNGFYSFNVDDADSLGSLLAGTLDPYLGIYPSTRPALPALGGVKSAVSMYAAGPLDVNQNDTLGAQYAGRNATAANIPPGQNYTINVDLGTSNNTELSFAAFDAMTEASRYYSSLPGSGNNSVQALFPTGENTSNFSNGRMHILAGDRYDWDVDMHEYGHYVQSLHAGISRPDAAGSHSSLDNLRYSRLDLTREQANGLAWSEGWATYFAISGQQEMGSSALGIQRVGDTIYNDNNDANGLTQGTTRYGIEDRAIGGRPGRGEDNEASVSRILLDLNDANNDAADRDRVSMGDKAIWNIIRNNNTDTLSKFWNALITQPGTTNTQRINFGAIFQAHNVSPQPSDTAVPNGTDFPLADLVQPTFEWAIPQGGKQSSGFNNDLLNDFGMIFINSADAIIWDTGLLGNVTQFTPNPLDWFNLTSLSDIYAWVVYGGMESGVGANAYTSGYYWSDAHYFTVGLAVPEPASFLLLVISSLMIMGRGHRRPPANL